MNIDLLTIDSAREAVLRRQTTAKSLVDSFYAKIESEDPKIGAYLTLCRERAYAQAAKMDAVVDHGDDLPPLGGIPVAVKDLFMTRGVRTTAGSKSSTSSSRPTTPRPSRDWNPQGPSSSANSIATSSQWDRRTRTRPTARCGIRETLRGYPEVHRAAPPQPSLPGQPWPHSVPIPVVRSVSRQHSAE